MNNRHEHACIIKESTKLMLCTKTMQFLISRCLRVC